MNGTDPSPAGHQHSEDSLITGHKVKVFLYNQQVTDSLTASLSWPDANKALCPVVGSL